MTLLAIHSELSGKVIRADLSVGQSIGAGQELFVIESMKMEIPMEAPASGQVTEVCVGEGDLVKEGQLLARVQT